MPGEAGGAIVCVTPNPALDRTLTVPDLQLGAVMRTTEARVAAGGKGVNVARALSALGTGACCMGPVGGASGKILADLAAAEGLDADWTWCEVETRSCTILVDPAARRATVINEAGPRLSAGDWKRLCTDVLARAARRPGSLRERKPAARRPRGGPGGALPVPGGGGPGAVGGFERPGPGRGARRSGA